MTLDFFGIFTHIICSRAHYSDMIGLHFQLSIFWRMISPSSLFWRRIDFLPLFLLKLAMPYGCRKSVKKPFHRFEWFCETRKWDEILLCNVGEQYEYSSFQILFLKSLQFISTIIRFSWWTGSIQCPHSIPIRSFWIITVGGKFVIKYAIRTTFSHWINESTLILSILNQLKCQYIYYLPTQFFVSYEFKYRSEELNKKW